MGRHDREPLTAMGHDDRVTSAVVKRMLDVGVAGLVLVMVSPVLVAVTVAVRVTHGSPVLFRQPRVGQRGQTFDLVKFRTMTDGRGPDGTLLADTERLTPLGRWLRSTSLDELPELVLVLRGQMSLVGPRPLPVRYRDRYTPEQFRRHEVLPGITGWAQINGRNLTGWDERLAFDVWYVDHRSLWLDLKIIARTVGVVARRQGISATGDTTMPELPPRP